MKSLTGQTSGHRTEARIVEVLRASDAPLAVAEIAEKLEMHPNGIRNHLQSMETRGLAVGRPEQGAIGRPRVLWNATPRAAAEAELPHTGWAMARSLARSIPATPRRLEEVERSGVDMGHELVDGMGLIDGDSDRVQTALNALGFNPSREEGADKVRYTLQTCPYAEAVKENPAVVCTLHKGIVRGVLDRVRPDAAVSAFEAHPPDIAGCVVEITETDANGSPTAR